jgi:antitoxin MazE9
MKLSVSLSDTDVRFLDTYAKAHGLASRSAAVSQAVRALRDSELGAAYEEAFAEWDESDDAAIWDRAAADGL